MAAYQDAIKCPKCGLTGEVTKKISTKDGNELQTVYCRNKRCEWFDTAWNVTVRADGSVPDPQNYTNKPKTYLVSKSEVERARQLALQYQEMSNRGGELQNPHGILR